MEGGTRACFHCTRARKRVNHFFGFLLGRARVSRQPILSRKRRRRRRGNDNQTQPDANENVNQDAVGVVIAVDAVVVRAALVAANWVNEERPDQFRPTRSSGRAWRQSSRSWGSRPIRRELPCGVSSGVDGRRLHRQRDQRVGRVSVRCARPLHRPHRQRRNCAGLARLDRRHRFDFFDYFEFLYDFFRDYGNSHRTLTGGAPSPFAREFARGR